MQPSLAPVFVTGISAPSGGGKTTITKRVSDLLPGSVSLFFDDYDGDTIHPLSFQQWLRDGADYNAWRALRLEADLRSLRTGRSIIHPLTGSTISSRGHVVFDNPLGYAHAGLAKLIDFMVFIDTPLDIAMARRLLRDFPDKSEEPIADVANNLRVEMATYLDHGRAAYLEMDRQVKPTCDLILDGSLSADDLAHRVVEEVTVRARERAHCT
jgi:uridine kinase